MLNTKVSGHDALVRYPKILFLACLKGLTLAAVLFKKSCFYFAVFISGLTVLSTTAFFVFIPFNQAYTNYSIGIKNGAYYHKNDPRTTGIIDYMTGHGPIPKSEELPLFRLYVKGVLERAQMGVPRDFYSRTMPELTVLAIEWHEKTHPKERLDTEERKAVVRDMFENAIKPPLKGFPLEVNKNVWRLLQAVGSPKVRWIEEQDETASRFVAHSANDKQTFYSPIHHTIYIRYGDSVTTLLDEVGHSKQFRDAPYQAYFKMGTAMASSFARAIFETAVATYKATYKNPESFEGEVHDPAKKEALLVKFDLAIVDEKVHLKPDALHICIAQDPLILK